MILAKQSSGFWRRFRLTPSPGAVQAEVEDDFHCMSVIVFHDGYRATQIVINMRRAPWSTCPGAQERLAQTFTGVDLAQFPARGEKKANCTHLYDLAQMAAGHAGSEEQVIYDILVSDPEEGQRNAEIRRNGVTLLSWVESGFKIVKPEAAAGIRLDQLRAWIETLAPQLQEPARMLQWGNMLANGRIIPLEQQSDATKMPPSCYTFQPERAVLAKRIGVIRRFSPGVDQPLDNYKVAILI